MKKFILTIVFVVSIIMGYSQVIVNGFTSDGRMDYRFINDFRNSFVQELKDYYYIEERNKCTLEQLKQELSFSNDNSGIFHGTISPRFTSGIYIINAQLGTLTSSPYLFSVNMEVVETETAHKFPIHLTNLKRSEMQEIVKNLAELIKSKSPIYFMLSFVDVEKDIYGINYGEDRGADHSDKLEIYDIDNENVLGIAKIKRVFIKSSHVKIDWFSKKSGDNVNLNDYRVRRDVDLSAVDNIEKKLRKYSEAYVDKIQNKKEKNFKKQRLLEMENNNWLILSVHSFDFNNDFETFFDQNNIFGFKPMVFGAQWNLSKAPLRMFFKGRYSLPHNIELPSLQFTEVESTFYEVGLGVQNQFTIGKILYPGISLAVYYAGVSSELKGVFETIKTSYNGMDIEATGNITLKLANMGFYSEIGFHYFPFMDSENNKLKGTATSLGIGVTVFF